MKTINQSIAGAQVLLNVSYDHIRELDRYPIPLIFVSTGWRKAQTSRANQLARAVDKFLTEKA
jgi:hypothetical protein